MKIHFSFLALLTLFLQAGSLKGQTLTPLDRENQELTLLLKLRTFVNLESDSNYFIKIFVLDRTAGAENCHSQYGEVVSDLIIVAGENDEVPEISLYKFENIMQAKNFALKDDSLSFQFENCKGLNQARFKIQRKDGRIFLLDDK